MWPRKLSRHERQQARLLPTEILITSAVRPEPFDGLKMAFDAAKQIPVPGQRTTNGWIGLDQSFPNASDYA